MNRRVLVTGAGGFIGHHLVSHLKRASLWVRGVDLRQPPFGATAADELVTGDLRDRTFAEWATRNVDDVYALAADMGGMGYISAHHARILHNNSLVNLQTAEAARHNGVGRLLFASSACVYPEFKQLTANAAPLKETDAYPAQPQDAYGWEKLVSERLYAHYRIDYGLETRIVRLHNVFGPLCAWTGGREKAPAAICRKVAMAKLLGSDEVDVWGDGQQTRSFCYVDDCVDGILRVMGSDYHEPVNLGDDRLVSINELVSLVSAIAGVSVQTRHVDGPQGVRGRNSDNALLYEVLSWRPTTSLEDGVRRTYTWIEAQVRNSLALHDART